MEVYILGLTISTREFALYFGISDFKEVTMLRGALRVPIRRLARLARCKSTGKATACSTANLPSRESTLSGLQSREEEYDVLIIGGGATGCGAALDAAARGLKVLCVEREDFGSGTSSRSTKLIWGGSRYLVQAFVSLLSYDLLRSPLATIKKFMADFNMVLNCHRERKFLLDKQPHLTNWLPIAVPITRWILWPPPFNFPPAALGPLGLFSAFFKFYDSLTGFTCPPSHIMNNSRAQRKVRETLPVCSNVIYFLYL